MKKKLLILIIITTILFLAFIGIMFKMITENGKCIDNPFGYSATKLRESGGYYNCYCDSLSPELLDFSFDENGITIIKPVGYGEINFSEVKFIDMKGGN